MIANEALERFHHDSQWLWLRLRVANEKLLQPLQRVIRQVKAEAKQPRQRFILDDNLRRLMML